MVRCPSTASAQTPFHLSAVKLQCPAACVLAWLEIQQYRLQYFKFTMHEAMNQVISYSFHMWLLPSDELNSSWIGNCSYHCGCSLSHTGFAQTCSTCKLSVHMQSSQVHKHGGVQCFTCEWCQLTVVWVDSSCCFFFCVSAFLGGARPLKL